MSIRFNGEDVTLNTKDTSFKPKTQDGLTREKPDFDFATEVKKLNVGKDDDTNNATDLGKKYLLNEPTENQGEDPNKELKTPTENKAQGTADISSTDATKTTDKTDGAQKSTKPEAPVKGTNGRYAVKNSDGSYTYYSHDGKKLNPTWARLADPEFKKLNDPRYDKDGNPKAEYPEQDELAKKYGGRKTEQAGIYYDEKNNMHFKFIKQLKNGKIYTVKVTLPNVKIVGTYSWFDKDHKLQRGRP